MPRSLVHFGSADLSRLPASLETLTADLYLALPLALPPGLRLQELDVSCSRLLVDWAQLCSQVRGDGAGSAADFSGGTSAQTVDAALASHRMHRCRLSLLQAASNTTSSIAWPLG